jgi:hypothetical protein
MQGVHLSGSPELREKSFACAAIPGWNGSKLVSLLQIADVLKSPPLQVSFCCGGAPPQEPGCCSSSAPHRFRIGTADMSFCFLRLSSCLGGTFSRCGTRTADCRRTSRCILRGVSPPRGRAASRAVVPSKGGGVKAHCRRSGRRVRSQRLRPHPWFPANGYRQFCRCAGRLTPRRMRHLPSARRRPGQDVPGAASEVREPLRVVQPKCAGHRAKPCSFGARSRPTSLFASFWGWGSGSPRGAWRPVADRDRRSDRWRLRCHPAPKAEHWLVCLSFAGGAAAYSFPVPAELSPDIDVVAAQYPGRRERRAEPCIEDIVYLADQAYQALIPWAERLLTLRRPQHGSRRGLQDGASFRRRRNPDGPPVRLGTPSTLQPPRRRCPSPGRRRHPGAGPFSAGHGLPGAGRRLSSSLDPTGFARRPPGCRNAPLPGRRGGPLP